jgi:hypothetical protein
MHFGTKSYLKSTRNHTARHALKTITSSSCIRLLGSDYFFKVFFVYKYIKIIFFKFFFDIITCKNIKKNYFF